MAGLLCYSDEAEFMVDPGKPKRIIDFHIHVFPDELAPRTMEEFTVVYGVKPLSDGTVADTVAYMDKVGIDISVPQPVATRPTQVRSINDWAFSIRSDRMIPFGALHPDYQDIAGEVNRLVDMGFKGIKLQPNWQEFYPDEERVLPIYEAVEGKLAILFHAGQEIGAIEDVRSTPERLRKVHDKFPGLRMIIGHMGGYDLWDEAEAKLSGTDVNFDMSFCPEEGLSNETLVRMVKKHGTKKVLFASDFPFADPGIDFERMMKLPFTADEREDIIWRNGARILGLS